MNPKAALSGRTTLSQIETQSEQNTVNHQTVKVAVASKDGISINLHFGHAKAFWIYQLSPESYSLLERRQVDHYCHGQTGDQSAMQKILKTIGDCSAVFVAKIGDGPIEKLRAIGVESIDSYAYLGVEDSLRDYASDKFKVNA